jgi:hypothetical protein
VVSELAQPLTGILQTMEPLTPNLFIAFDSSNVVYALRGMLRSIMLRIGCKAGSVA